MTANLIIPDGAPAFVGVKRALRARIGREWQVGDRLPSVTELARELGVGQNNAHRAIRELVHEGVLFSRRRLGTFVREMPPAENDADGLQPSLPLRQRQITLVRQPGEGLSFIERMLRGAQAVLHEAGAATTIEHIESPLIWQPATGTDAAIFFNINSGVQMPAGHFPCALVSSSDHHHPQLRSRLDVVSVDQIHGGGLAARALREAGCQSVCFVGARLRPRMLRYQITTELRLTGFELIWGDVLPESHLLRVPGYSLGAGSNGFAKYLLLDPRPEGVFCASDDLALGFIAAAAEAGLRPGRDFQLVGFDGQDRRLDPNADGAQLLTTVRIPAEQMGRQAATMLVERLAQPGLTPRSQVLCATLSYGSSTRRMRNS